MIYNIPRGVGTIWPPARVIMGVSKPDTKKELNALAFVFAAVRDL
jgi:hypothetical protein